MKIARSFVKRDKCCKAFSLEEDKSFLGHCFLMSKTVVIMAVLLYLILMEGMCSNSRPRSIKIDNRPVKIQKNGGWGRV
jgi:hypothetical protein